jgi:hypothetical protein
LVKAAVTPSGNVDVENVTDVVAPDVRVAVIEEDGLVEPAATDRMFGEGVDSVKPKTDTAGE